MRVSPTAPGLVGTGVAAPGTSLPLPSLTVSLWLISPVSSAVGSPRLAYAQNITSAGVPGAGFWVVVLDFVVQLVAWICGEGRVVRPDPSGIAMPEGSVSMSLPELAEFVARLKTGRWDPPAKAYPAVVEGEVTRPGVQVISPAYLTLFLLVSGTVSGREGAPMLSIFVPLISFKGLTGGLPILIMGLIATILVRTVVPPTSSGLLPDEQAQEPVFQLKAQELIQLLRGFGKYFK